MDKISQLIKFLNHSQQVTPPIIEDFLFRLKLNEEDLSQWMVLDRSDQQSGRKMIHQAKNYEIMLVSWDKNEFSSIHHHEQVDWGSIQIFGTAKYAVFQIDEGFKIKRLSEKMLTDNEVIHIDDGIIHQLGNDKDEPFFSLHIYGNNKACENISLSAKNYTIKKNRLVYLSEGVFI